MLPIMTFRAAQLSPSLEYVFDPRWLDPFESVVGMQWKFARANGVAGHIVVGQLTDKPVDVYAGGLRQRSPRSPCQGYRGCLASVRRRCLRVSSGGQGTDGIDRT